MKKLRLTVFSFSTFAYTWFILSEYTIFYDIISHLTGIPVSLFSVIFLSAQVYLLRKLIAKKRNDNILSTKLLPRLAFSLYIICLASDFLASLVSEGYLVSGVLFFTKYSLFAYSIYLCTKISWSLESNPFLIACKRLLPYFFAFAILSIFLFYSGLSLFECNTDFLRKNTDGIVGQSFYFFPSCTGLFINDIPFSIANLTIYRFSSFFFEPAAASYFLITATTLTSSFSTLTLYIILLLIHVSIISLTSFASTLIFIVLAIFRLFLRSLTYSITSGNVRILLVGLPSLLIIVLFGYSDLYSYILSKLGSMQLSIEYYSRIFSPDFLQQFEPFNLKIQPTGIQDKFGYVSILSSLSWLIYFLFACYLLIISFLKGNYKFTYLITTSLLVVLKSPFHYLPSFILFTTLYFSSIILSGSLRHPSPSTK